MTTGLSTCTSKSCNNFCSYTTSHAAIAACHAPFFHNHEQNCSNIIITNEQEGRFQYESIWWVFTIILEKNHSVKELDTTRPPPSYLTLTLTRMKMYKSDDQMIKSQSHSHSHSQNILILSSSSRCLDSRALLSLSQHLDKHAFSSLAQSRYTCLLFSFTQPRYTWIGLCFSFSRSPLLL